MHLRRHFSGPRSSLELDIGASYRALLGVARGGQRRSLVVDLDELIEANDLDPEVSAIVSSLTSRPFAVARVTNLKSTAKPVLLTKPLHFGNEAFAHRSRNG
jgi:hypothetical protein